MSVEGRGGVKDYDCYRAKKKSEGITYVVDCNRPGGEVVRHICRNGHEPRVETTILKSTRVSERTLRCGMVLLLAVEILLLITNDLF